MSFDSIEINLVSHKIPPNFADLPLYVPAHALVCEAASLLRSKHVLGQHQQLQLTSTRKVCAWGQLGDKSLEIITWDLVWLSSSSVGKFEPVFWLRV